MLTAGQALALTSTAMRTPRPQIDWYKGDKYIANSSRIQINKTEICDSTLVSALVIPSVTVGDSGTYECRVENSAGNASLPYQVLVSECVHSDIHCWYCHCQSPTPSIHYQTITTYNDMRIYMCGSLKNFFMLKINFLLN